MITKPVASLCLLIMSRCHNLKIFSNELLIELELCQDTTML